MKIIPTLIQDVLLLEPKVFADERGYFFESYSEKVWTALGMKERFVQDNQSLSRGNVMRGLHYQIQHPQGKLVRVAVGEILDVAVDLRRSSPTFGKWAAERLSGENKRMLWIPPGFAHGFSVFSDSAHVLYKATDVYFPSGERTILWNDPDLNIQWQLKGEPIVSAKDRAGQSFKQAEVFD